MTLTLRLKPGREKLLLRGHPWVFSGAVAAAEGPADAAIATVFAADGTCLGPAFHSPRSQIRARLLGPGVAAVDRAFFAARLAQALELRRAVVPPDTTGYRLVNAEGDGLPGWTVDRFGEVLVSQVTSAGLEALRQEAYAALTAALPGSPVLQANRLAVRRREGLSQEDEVVAGSPPAEAEFTESGLTFTAELADGQKTGFYCDQRENRRLAGGLAADREVLDLFAHSGAFGLYARRGGARRVLHVESSARLIARGRRHYQRNRMAEEGIEWLQGDAFEELRRLAGSYGLIVCDPPPLVRRRNDLEAGSRAYKDANRLALARLAPGGFLLTFSCSAAVDALLFRQILLAAAAESGVRLALLAPLGPAPDHPVAAAHFEGEYLKGWWAWRPD